MIVGLNLEKKKKKSVKRLFTLNETLVLYHLRDQCIIGNTEYNNVSKEIPIKGSAQNFLNPLAIQ